MKIERLKQISYAEGVVEDFIENSVEAASESDRATNLLTMWQTVAAGLKELRQENLDLSQKLEVVKNTLG